MRKQLTVILILLNLVVVALFYLFERPGPDDDIKAKRKIFGEEAVDIDYIRISGSSLGPDRVLKKVENNWHLTSPIEWPANFFAVGRILNQITFLEKETSFLVSELQAAGRDLASYGLEEPQMKLEFGKGIARTSITIGSSTEVGNRIYILSPDQKEIMVIQRGLFDSLLVDLGNLRSQSVFDIPLFEVQTISLQKSYPTPLRIRISRFGEDWRFEIPFKTRADRAEVEMVINGLNSLSVQSFETNPEPDLSIYGLDNPKLYLTIEATDKRQTILIGKQLAGTEGDALYYAKGSENGTIFTIPGLLIDQNLSNAQEELRERQFVKFDPNSLSTIEITQSNRSVSLQKLETGTWQVIRRDEDGSVTAEVADTKKLANMMSTLYILRAQSFISEAPSNADLETYGFTDPQRTIQLKGGTPLKLLVGDLVPGNSRHAYAKLEQEPFIYEIDTSILSEFHTRPFNYRLRILHQEPEDAKLVGMTVLELASDTTVYNAVLNEVTPTWKAIAAANQSDEEGRESLLSLVSQSKSIEAREFIEEDFDKVPWKYRLDMHFKSSENSNTSSWTTPLWVTERLTGTNTIGGIKSEGGVFYTTQAFADAFFKLTFARFDPGPETEPAPESLPPDVPPSVEPEPVTPPSQ
ncbi:MAG: DUF4340 domain-containing protein [Verrucomicrobia bacterium]|nr:DUF4340 domain-containing protein [Verrucomicrobiota bacterium]